MIALSLSELRPALRTALHVVVEAAGQANEVNMTESAGDPAAVNVDHLTVNVGRTFTGEKMNGGCHF